MALPSLARVAAPSDPILGLSEASRADSRPGKINLSSGVFVDETGTTPVLASVLEAERRILAAGRSKLYRPIDGEASFQDAVPVLLTVGATALTRLWDVIAVVEARPPIRGRSRPSLG